MMDRYVLITCDSVLLLIVEGVFGRGGGFWSVSLRLKSLYCTFEILLVWTQESLGSKFKRQLHALMAAIQRTEVQYVRCIKPNANKSKDELDYLMVVEQLRCAGVIEVGVCVQILRELPLSSGSADSARRDAHERP